MANIFQYMLYFLLSLLLAGCQNNTNMHEWYPSECAPEAYPVEILKGEIVAADGKAIPIPDRRLINNGWGEIGSTVIADPIKKGLPRRVTVKWFSYTENKFYGADFELPQDEVQSAFEKGYISPISGKRLIYNRVLVGLAPQGGVAVWLKGEKITREIAFSQAKEVTEDWASFSHNSRRPRAEYIRLQLQQVLDTTVPKPQRAGDNPWALGYRTAYPWTIKVISRSTVTQVLARFYNGEFFMFLPDDSPAAVQGHPLPQALTIYWNDPGATRWGAEITFDFPELEQAFKSLNTPGGGRLMLQSEINSTLNSVSLYLRNDKAVYAFKKAAARVFRI